MVPLFKTHSSIGKSILTTDRVFEICSENGWDEIFAVEDSMLGFLDWVNKSKDTGVSVRFGLRTSICNNANKEKDRKESEHKVIIFALDDEGCKILYKISSHSATESSDIIDFDILKEYWDNKHLALAIPFYDSFIFKNLHGFNNCIPDLSFIEHKVFFLEDNKLPFDNQVRRAVESYCRRNGYETWETKTILYENRCDAESLQVYKITTGRSGFTKKVGLDNPNLEHFGSREFCLEAFLENEFN